MPRYWLSFNFLKTRDEACEHGEILQSRALLYTQSDLMRSVEELKAQKQLSEQPEDETTPDGNEAKGEDSTSTATFNMQQVMSRWLGSQCCSSQIFFKNDDIC